MKKIINLSFLTIFLFCSLLPCYNQNTPANGQHIKSITEGITAPFRIAVKNTGTIYVSDVKQNRIVKFDDNLNLLGSIDQISSPRALAINDDDIVYVGDYNSGIIYLLDASETPILFSSVVNAPSSMVFDTNGLLYVIDSKLNQVTVLDNGGNYVRSIGNGSLLNPTGITYDRIKNRILVSEHGGIGPDIGGGMMGGGYPLTKVWIFDTDGNNLGEIGKGGGDDDEFYRIQGMDISKKGTIFVLDPYQSSISAFEEDGTYLNTFGEYGKSPGSLYMPMDVAFDSQNRMLVSSMITGSIEVFDVNETNPTYKLTTSKSTICEGSSTSIKVDFTGKAPWTFTYTVDGTNPVTITETFSDPYIISASEPGLYELTNLTDANFEATDYSNSLLIKENPLPTSTVTSGNAEICTGTSTNVSFSFTGIAPFRFTYTNGTTPVTINNYYSNYYEINTSTEGIYEITYLRSDGGCIGSSFTGSAEIAINPLPSSVLSAVDTVICEGESTDLEIQFTGTAPWTFTYSIDGTMQPPVTTSNNPHIIPTSTPGTYNITALSDAVNTGNCFTGAPTIKVIPLPTSNILTPEVTACGSDTSDIQIELTGDAPWNLTYSINGVVKDSVNNIEFSPYYLSIDEPGQYTVSKLGTNGCIGSQLNGEAVVTYHSVPTANIPIGSPNIFICNDETYDIEVDLTGTAPWTYTFSIDGLNQETVTTSNSQDFITASTTGKYKIEDINDKHCTGEIAPAEPRIHFRENPTAKITSENISICEGDTANLIIELSGTAPWNLTYTRNGLNPVNITSANSPLVIPVTEEGRYEVSELHDANGIATCLGTSANISFITAPSATIENKYISICNGNTLSLPISLKGSAPWTFTYTQNEVNPVTITTSEHNYLLNITRSGTYSITSVSDANCNTTGSLSKSFIGNFPKTQIDLGEDLELCEGDHIQLDAGEFDNYLWDDGSENRTYNIYSAGTYHVNATDVYGCNKSDTIVISKATSAQPDFTYIVNGNEVRFTNLSVNADSYLWDFGDLTTSKETNPVYVYQNPGTYNIILTAINDKCGETILVKTIEIVSTDIYNTELNNVVQVYPNPNDGIFTIDFSGMNGTALELYITNISGQKIYYEKLSNTVSGTHINLKHIPTGIYNLNITTKDKTITKRIIITK